MGCLQFRVLHCSIQRKSMCKKLISDNNMVTPVVVLRELNINKLSYRYQATEDPKKSEMFRNSTGLLCGTM